MSDGRGFWLGRRVWVTGASSGIGRAVAEHAALRGARVALTARREARLRDLADALPGDALVAPADVVDEEAVQRAGERIHAAWGGVDVLIASAGVFRTTDGLRWESAPTRQVMRTNVEGVANAIAAVLPGMLERGAGHVAGVASMAGVLPLRGGAAYCASKAALIALLDSLRLDLRGSGVRVSTLVPGYVDTPMITDEERRTQPDLISVADAAERICRTIEKGWPFAAFPWRSWTLARLLGHLPRSLYTRVMSHLPPLPESPPGSESQAAGGVGA